MNAYEKQLKDIADTLGTYVNESTIDAAKRVVAERDKLRAIVVTLRNKGKRTRDSYGNEEHVCPFCECRICEPDCKLEIVLKGEKQ